MQLNLGFWVITLAAAVGLAASVLWTIARGASASALSAPSQRLLIRGAALLMALWATIVVLAAEAGAFQFSPSFPIPFIGIGVAAPIVIGALIFALSPALRAAVAAAPQENIIGIQAFRALGIVFIILLAEKRLPAEFALPAGIGDVLVGLAALAGCVSVRVARTVRTGRGCDIQPRRHLGSSHGGRRWLLRIDDAVAADFN
jgi:hypothetical protein